MTIDSVLTRYNRYMFSLDTNIFCIKEYKKQR